MLLPGFPMKPSKLSMNSQWESKGPLTTPVSGNVRSVNVALRKALDLYVCVRPIRYFVGIPCPVTHPEYMDMVIFRENTEDIYAGIEFEYGSEGNKQLKVLLKDLFPAEYAKMRFPKLPASASSRFPRRAPFAWCERLFNGRW